MPRAKSNPKTRKKKWMKLAKGYVGGRGHLYRVAKNAAMKALMYSYIHRRQKKRDMRRLQIVKINAACRQHGITYSQLIHKLKEKGIEFNRKVLAELAENQPDAFRALVEEVVS